MKTLHEKVFDRLNELDPDLLDKIITEIEFAERENDQEEIFHLCQYSEGICVWCGHIKNLPDEQDELLNNSEK